jgi:hypothetical protein
MNTIPKERAQKALKLARESLLLRVGTADGDVNVLDLPLALPRWALEDLANMAEDYINEW